jgi:FKBP-type peptidyl-prolyl cis-trans isomerase FkpA
MRRVLIFLTLLGTMNVMAQDSIQIQPPLESASDSIDYFFGINLGLSLAGNPYIKDQTLVIEGFIRAIEGKGEHDPNASKAILTELLTAMASNSAPIQSAESIENLSLGKAFLAENGKKEGMVTTESGLQYEIITPGEGPKPATSSTVEVHYEGKLIDGTEFDSSYKRGETISFPLNRVIKGWTEGVQLMQVGSTFRFFIPSELAYGSRNKGSIPPNSVLIFKIELLGIK